MSYNNYFEQHPPLHILVASYIGYEPPVKIIPEENTQQKALEFETMIGGLPGVQTVTMKMPTVWPGAINV